MAELPQLEEILGVFKHKKDNDREIRRVTYVTTAAHRYDKQVASYNLQITWTVRGSNPGVGKEVCLPFKTPRPAVESILPPYSKGAAVLTGGGGGGGGEKREEKGGRGGD